MLVVDVMLCNVLCRTGTGRVAVNVGFGCYVVYCAVCRTGTGGVAVSVGFGCCVV